MNKKNMLHAALLLIIGTVIFLGLNAVFGWNMKRIAVKDREVRDSDVILAGTSQGFFGINPQILWDEYGIPAYNYCNSGEYIGQTFYVLQDVLTYQKPKVIVLDIESMTRPEDFLKSPGNMFSSLYAIRDVKLRYECYNRVIRQEKQYFIPFFRFHGRWKELDRRDFEFQAMAVNFNGKNTLGYFAGLGNGFVYHTGDNQELPELDSQLLPGSIAPEDLEYLQNIYQLSTQHGCDLVLIDMPSYDGRELAENTLYLKNWAGERGIPFMSYNGAEAYGKMALAPDDFADRYHLNIRGADKLSSRLGEQLRSEYRTLEDKRGLKEYDKWAGKVEDCRKRANNAYIKKENDLAKYLGLIRQDRYDVAVSFTGSNEQLPETAMQELIRLGMNEELFRSGGVWLKINQEKYRYPHDQPVEPEHFDLGNSDLLIVNTDGHHTDMIFDQDSADIVSKGLNIAVYDRELGILLDMAGFDEENQYARSR